MTMLKMKSIRELNEKDLVDRVEQMKTELSKLQTENAKGTLRKETGKIRKVQKRNCKIIDKIERGKEKMNLNIQSEFDLIGQEITISDSKNSEIVGINGKIIMETKNMFVINTKSGKKNIPKNICQLSNDKGIIKTNSTKLSKRPHERLEMLA